MASGASRTLSSGPFVELRREGPAEREGEGPVAARRSEGGRAQSKKVGVTSGPHWARFSCEAAKSPGRASAFRRSPSA